TEDSLEERRREQPRVHAGVRDGFPRVVALGRRRPPAGSGGLALPGGRLTLRRVRLVPFTLLKSMAPNVLASAARALPRLGVRLLPERSPLRDFEVARDLGPRPHRLQVADHPVDGLPGHLVVLVTPRKLQLRLPHAVIKRAADALGQRESPTNVVR